jgi:hypothetical protein
MDTYQPIYDAVRSRIHNGDIGEAVQSAMREANVGHWAHMAFETLRETISRYEAPSAIYRPRLYKDGTDWCALYGDNLQEGVCGFGDTPAQAMAAFDAAWHKKI